jgi:Diaphanous GTPase-binding Domain
MGTAQAASAADADHHRRAKTSVLKSFIHKRTPSKGTTLPSTATDAIATNAALNTKLVFPDSLVEHPHARALGEVQNNQYNHVSSPNKSKDDSRPSTTGVDSKSLHKKTKSIISLRSLVGRHQDVPAKSNDASLGKPKKSKSSTNLTALLSRPRSSKNIKTAAAQEEVYSEKNKENQAPPSSLTSESTTQSPIYAAFASQHFTSQPLGGKFIENEIDLYTPQEYSPSKQRNFYGGPGSQPTLGQSQGKRRPMSTFLPTTYSIHDMKKSSEAQRRSADQPRQISLETRGSMERKNAHSDPKQDMTLAKRGARVMAAVAALGTKAKSSESGPKGLQDIKDVDFEFEAMLDRRNIPENQRHKMRSLALSMKKDFIRQDWAETAAIQSNRPASNDSNAVVDDTLGKYDNAEVKAKRPRSKTFTLSRSSKEPSSPTKKSRPESTFRGHSRTKSSDSTVSYGKSFTSTSAAVASSLIAKAKGQLPDDFVAYLRKVQKPESVEVGKLHKLRLLLRNETVAWTDEFIGLGGMTEIVGLLYRTLEVEWRFVPLYTDVLELSTNIGDLKGRNMKMLCFTKCFSASRRFVRQRLLSSD